MEHYKNLSLDNLFETVDGELITERWRSIIGYEGLYEISTFGRVKSLRRLDFQGRLLKEKILSQAVNQNGYTHVVLWKDGIDKDHRIHRLVAAAFLCVNHKSGVKTDNRLSNLEYVTHSENNTHSYKELNRVPGMTGKYDIGGESVTQMSISGKVIAVHKSVSAAARAVKTQTTNIHKCLKGDRNSAGGYTWKR